MARMGLLLAREGTEGPEPTLQGFILSQNGEQAVRAGIGTSWMVLGTYAVVHKGVAKGAVRVEAHPLVLNTCGDGPHVNRLRVKCTQLTAGGAARDKPRAWHVRLSLPGTPWLRRNGSRSSSALVRCKSQLPCDFDESLPALRLDLARAPPAATWPPAHLQLLLECWGYDNWKYAVLGTAEVPVVWLHPLRLQGNHRLCLLRQDAAVAAEGEAAGDGDGAAAAARTAADEARAVQLQPLADELLGAGWASAQLTPELVQLAGLPLGPGATAAGVERRAEGGGGPGGGRRAEVQYRAYVRLAPAAGPAAVEPADGRPAVDPLDAAVKPAALVVDSGAAPAVAPVPERKTADDGDDENGKGAEPKTPTKGRANAREELGPPAVPPPPRTPNYRAGPAAGDNGCSVLLPLNLATYNVLSLNPYRCGGAAETAAAGAQRWAATRDALFALFGGGQVLTGSGLAPQLCCLDVVCLQEVSVGGEGVDAFLRSMRMRQYGHVQHGELAILWNERTMQRMAPARSTRKDSGKRAGKGAKGGAGGAGNADRADSAPDYVWTRACLDEAWGGSTDRAVAQRYNAEVGELRGQERDTFFRYPPITVVLRRIATGTLYVVTTAHTPGGGVERKALKSADDAAAAAAVAASEAIQYAEVAEKALAEVERAAEAICKARGAAQADALAINATAASAAAAATAASEASSYAAHAANIAATGADAARAQTAASRAEAAEAAARRATEAAAAAAAAAELAGEVGDDDPRHLDPAAAVGAGGVGGAAAAAGEVAEVAVEAEGARAAPDKAPAAGAKPPLHPHALKHLKQLKREVEWLLGERSYFLAIKDMVRRRHPALTDKELAPTTERFPLAAARYPDAVVHVMAGDFNTQLYKQVLAHVPTREKRPAPHLMPACLKAWAAVQGSTELWFEPSTSSSYADVVYLMRKPAERAGLYTTGLTTVAMPRRGKLFGGASDHKPLLVSLTERRQEPQPVEQLLSVVAVHSALGHADGAVAAAGRMLLEAVQEAATRGVAALRGFQEQLKVVLAGGGGGVPAVPPVPEAAL